MKRISLRLLALLFTAILVLPLVGCGQTPPAEEEAPDETAEPAPEPLTVVADGTSVYQIVRPELCTQQLTDAAVALNRQIKAMTGVGLTITTDWENERISSTLAGEYEIVLGETTRNGKYFTYDTADIGTYDYDITVIENRVLILGGSETATASAVEYFIEHCLPAAPTDTIEIDPALHVEYRAPESDRMTVMSLNLLATDTEYAANANNNQHLIQVRQPRIREIILTHMPDSIGLQECSAPWRQYFDGMDASWSYDRTGASKTQKISILYNTERKGLALAYSISCRSNSSDIQCPRKRYGADAVGCVLPVLRNSFDNFRILGRGDNLSRNDNACSHSIHYKLDTKPVRKHGRGKGK